jgi:formate dehydrogenase subunit gamma
MATVVQTVAGVRAAEEKKIKRFDVHQIIQHAGLMVSFILLVLTGLPLKFASLGISRWWIGVWGGVDVTRSVHHFAAWMMLAVCVYHVGYLIYTIAVLKRPFPVKMIPTPGDAIQLVQEILYYLGLRQEKPLVDRFNWKEKFDYWAIFWGMPVMFISGFILMYPVFATSFLPGWAVPAALVAHSDEAMLALVWIMMIHIFFNHFSPSHFPLNKSIFTGKVPEEKYRHEHPLEYDRIMPSREEVPPVAAKIDDKMS